MLKKNNFFKNYFTNLSNYKKNLKKTEKVFNSFIVDLKNNQIPLLKSYDKEVEVLKKLLQFTPDDPQALRLAVQAAGFSNNKEFGDYAISLMEIHNPGAVSLAKGFLESALNQSNK